MKNRHPLLIDGEWVDGAATVLNENPSDLDTPIGEYDIASAAQAEIAIGAAENAFSHWASHPMERIALLEEVGRRLWIERHRLGKILSSEEGKTLQEGIGEVARASKTYTYFAQRVLASQGTVIPSTRPGVHVSTRRRPIGVVGVISPWNFPLAVPAWKIAPALAAGNTVVFKAAELVPASAWELARIIHDAGAPPGVFNLVTGKGREVGERLATHPTVAGLTFTGSTSVGQHLLATVHASSPRRVQAEMGGKNPLVIMDDASLDLAVAATLDSAYGATGQRCTASSRIIVQDGILDRFVTQLTKRLGEMNVGHALDPATNIGPVAHAAQLATDVDAITLGLSEGATLVHGGELLSAATRGHFLSPALFVDGSNSMQLNQQEIFGPVACVIPAADLDEAIFLANDTSYGLSSGIITSSLRSSEEFQRRASAGLISVNASPAVSEFQAPFGGNKQSSYGPREQGETAFDFYTSISTHFVHAGD